MFHFGHRSRLYALYRLLSVILLLVLVLLVHLDPNVASFTPFLVMERWQNDDEGYKNS